MKRHKIFFLLTLFVLAGSAAYFSVKHYSYLEEVKRQKVILENRRLAWKGLRQNLLNELSRFEGEAAIVIKDLQMDWEISFNKEELFPAASLAKIPIMTACFKAAKEGRLRFTDAIELKAAYRVSGSGLLKEMPYGTYFSVERLIKLMITESDNTAANILISLLGFDYLNYSFAQAGLERTNLYRKMMDFKDRRRGVENYTTAEDMASILEQLYRGEFLNKDVSGECLLILKEQKINDRIPARLPAETVVAHKTGLERNVCHDVGIVFTEKGDFLICVLTKHIKANKPAKKFISDVALDTYNYYQQF